MSIVADPMIDSRRERYREEERESLQKQGDLAQMKRLLKYLAPRRRAVMLAIGLSVAIALLAQAPMIIIKHAIDGYIVPGNYNGLYLMAGMLVATQGVLFFIDHYSQYLISRIGQDSMTDLRTEVFDHLQKQPLRFFDRNPVGRLITRITSDVNVLNELFAQGVVGIFQQIFSLIVILGILFYYNWYLTLCVLPTIPLIGLASRNFRNNVFTSYRLTRVRLSRLNTFMQENITGMRTVQANTREESQFHHFDELNDAHRNAHIQTVFQYALFFPLVEIISALGLALILWQGGLRYFQGSISAPVTLGMLSLFIQSLDKFFQPIKDLSEKYNTVQSAIAASERLFLLLDTQPTITDAPAPQALPEFGKTIEFRDVWFAYNPDEWVLKGVSFKVEKGQTIAIVGPTGSGKTTLMSLLCRFYDIQRGSILIDGIDIREISQSELREKIAIVMQDVFLFHGTVAENIRLGNRAISDERVHRVAEETGFADFVARFPKGYDTGVKERGATLSTGQKQLLSFTRALAFDPEILILDEATANIDTESEERLQRAVTVLCAGRTSLVIAHRLSTIQRADRIIVIHHGLLAEEGTHQQLLAQNGIYRRLYDLQYKEQVAG
ncbi:ABC transporter ATP-binding protein [soil metagenome]